MMSDRLHDVCFPQPDIAVDEERIVRAGGGLRDGKGSCMREVVGRPDDKLVEREFRIQSRTRLRPGETLANGLANRLRFFRDSRHLVHVECDVARLSRNRGDCIFNQRKVILFQPGLVEVVVDGENQSAVVERYRFNDRDPAGKDVWTKNIG